MNQLTIERFLHRNPIEFKWNISFGDLHIFSIGDPHILSRKCNNKEIYLDFTININSITSIGLNYKEVFIETKFGKYSFNRKEESILKRIQGSNQKELLIKRYENNELWSY